MKFDISGFHKMTVEQRLELIKKMASLSEEDTAKIKSHGALDIETANRMIENVIGTFELPYGIATNFVVNGREYLVPMVLEEPSVVAAASKSAKIARVAGGFKTSSDDSVMIGQIQLVRISNPEEAKKSILSKKHDLLSSANQKDTVLTKHGGGAKDIEVRVIDTPKGKNIVVHLLVNVKDAMGANVVNTMCEAISPKLEELTGGKTRLRIVSNLAVKRLARAEATWDKKALEESFSE